MRPSAWILAVALALAVALPTAVSANPPSGAGKTGPAAGNPALDAERQKLRAAEALYTRTKREHQARPKDAARRKAFVEATVTFGNVVMFSAALPPREKYPRALALYREALRLDPKNATALKNKKTIEDIYRSMNRPIPQG